MDAHTVYIFWETCQQDRLIKGPSVELAKKTLYLVLTSDHMMVKFILTLSLLYFVVGIISVPNNLRMKPHKCLKTTLKMLWFVWGNYFYQSPHLRSEYNVYTSQRNKHHPPG